MSHSAMLGSNKGIISLGGPHMRLRGSLFRGVADSTHVLFMQGLDSSAPFSVCGNLYEEHTESNCPSGYAA